MRLHSVGFDKDRAHILYADILAEANCSSHMSAAFK
jgi:hypothetical protein